MDKLLSQFGVRLQGDNGVATGLIHLSNSFETWITKLNSVVHGNSTLPDPEWLRFYQLLDDWTQVLIITHTHTHTHAHTHPHTHTHTHTWELNTQLFYNQMPSSLMNLMQHER